MLISYERTKLPNGEEETRACKSVALESNCTGREYGVHEHFNDLCGICEYKEKQKKAKEERGRREQEDQERRKQQEAKGGGGHTGGSAASSGGGARRK